VMHRFNGGHTDVLLSTTIIESGLDIPNANTLIVDRADTFGLAQLYQLRGRVGRGAARAYAYFFRHGKVGATREAQQRLEVIAENTELGSGYSIAMRDLEIRGAGNIFGPEQSGHIHEIGFDLYIEMLEKAVAELRGEEIMEETEPLIDLNISALIPETYVEDVMIRMSLYRRISSLKTDKNIEELGAELRDRFGQAPQEVSNLLAVMRLKLVARELMTLKIQTVQERVRVVFSPDTPVQPEMIFNLHEAWKGRMKFLPDGFEIDMKKRDADTMLAEIYQAADALRQGLPVGRVLDQKIKPE